MMFKYILDATRQAVVTKFLSATVIHEYHSNVTKKISYTSPKTYVFFQCGSLVGIGKWNLENDGLQDLDSGAHVTCVANIVFRMSLLMSKYAKLSKGTRVELVDLKSKHEYNGLKGSVVKRQEDGNYQVLVGDKTLIVRPPNLLIDELIPNILRVHEMGNVMLVPAEYPLVNTCKKIFKDALDKLYVNPKYSISKKVLCSYQVGNKCVIEAASQKQYLDGVRSSKSLHMEDITSPAEDDPLKSSMQLLLHIRRCIQAVQGPQCEICAVYES